MKNRTRRTAFLLFVLAFWGYVFPLAYNTLVTPFFHVIPSQDVVSASLIPSSVLTRGNFYLDQYRTYIARNYPEPYFVDEQNQHLVSRYPVTAGVLALPFVGWGLGTGWIARTVNVFDVAKVSAAFITALAIVAFFFCARELTDLSTSRLVTIAFAFGSSVWATASQGLWQHTPSILFQALAFWFLLRDTEGGGWKTLAPAGLFLSLATIARPPVLVIALVFSLFVLFYHRNAFVPFVLFALPPLILALIYNFLINGSLFVFGYQEGAAQIFAFPQWEAIQGLLFSSGRGLFVYSPFLLLIPVGIWYGWRQPQRFFYIFLALAFVAYTGIMAAWGSLGGWAYGSRMLTDTLPAACLLIIPAIEKIRGKWRGALWGIVFLAAGVQSLGLWDYGVRFHADPANSVWSIENNEPLFYLKAYISMLVDNPGN